MPPKGRDPSLHLYIEMVKEDITNGLSRNKWSNASEQERKAIKDIMNNDIVVARPAYKRS